MARGLPVAKHGPTRWGASSERSPETWFGGGAPAR